jgi:hypothetical protein
VGLAVTMVTAVRFMRLKGVSAERKTVSFLNKISVFIRPTTVT